MRRPPPGSRFGIASTTKTFVATVVLQLAEEGRLSLDESVEQSLPGRLADGRRISVRQLLNHTSGLPPDFSPDLPPGTQQPLLFRPGTALSYANANYDVLGLIVERVTGRRLDLVVRDRIFRPLGLAATSYGRTSLPRTAAMPPWLGVPEDGEDGPVGGAGGIVSTIGDLATFLRALMRGELLGKAVMSELTRTVAAEPKLRAGLGLFEFSLACGSAWGHGGEEPAYSSHVIAARDGSKVVVVAQTGFGWLSARETAERMFCQAGS